VSEDRTVDERLGQIENDVIEIQAQQGRVKLEPGTLVLLWAMVLAAFGCVIFVVRLEGRMEAYSRILMEDHQRLGEHVRDNGHPVIDQKLNELQRDVDRLEKRLP
jgi:hypothetical protein